MDPWVHDVDGTWLSIDTPRRPNPLSNVMSVHKTNWWNTDCGVAERIATCTVWHTARMHTIANLLKLVN